MSFRFVAVPDAASGLPTHGIAFECTDYYGRSHLFFGARAATEDVRAAIGREFWGLLLSAAEELADYGDRAYHPGAGAWMEYGCRSGELFYSESADG